MKRIENCKHELKYPYYVTKEGRVYSEFSQKFLTVSYDKDGYLKVRMSSKDLQNGKQHLYSVHRLVLENFNTVEDMKNLQVNHIDGDKTNNNIANLQWATCKENIHHAIDNNLRAKINGSAKLSESDVMEIIKRLLSKEACSSICKDFNVHEETIARIKRKRSWKKLTENIIFN